MRYKIRPSCFTGEWVVEVWEEEEGEGELSLIAFSGPFAEEWATEYAAFKEGHVRQSVASARIHEQSVPVSSLAMQDSGLTKPTRSDDDAAVLFVKYR